MRLSSRGRTLRPVVMLFVVGVALAALAIASDASRSFASSRSAAQRSVKGSAAAGTIPVTFVGDMTGLLGYLGVQVNDGLQLALKSVNRSHLLKQKLSLTVLDTTSTPATATTEMAQAVDSKAAAIFGPVSSAEAADMTPLAERAHSVFYVFGELPDAVAAGKYVYRLQASELHFMQLMYNQLAKQSVKSVNLLYSSDQAALVQYAKQAPGQLSKLKIKVGSSIGIPTATTDYSSVVTSLMSGNPQAIGLYNTAGAVASIITALRNAGYTGQIFSIDGVTGGGLDSAGSAAYGTLYPTAYSPQFKFPTSVAFTKAWRKAYPKVAPNAYGAFGYDSMMALAQAIKLSGKATRAGVLAGMQKLAAAGSLSGAQGPITFIRPEKRDVSAPGGLVRWGAKGETLLKTGKPGLLSQPLSAP
jgi:branched-chain amino acid transport system substrate-binding protein